MILILKPVLQPRWKPLNDEHSQTSYLNIRLWVSPGYSYLGRRFPKHDVTENPNNSRQFQGLLQLSLD